jgi:multidrug efflux pump subunit AcrA (membrane-fusion protein)
MQRKWIVMGVLLLGVVAFFIGSSEVLGDRQHPREESVAAAETMEALSAPIEEDEGTVTVEAVVEPARWVELRPVNIGAGRTVAEAPVAEGDVVVEGDLLVRFDAAEETLAVELAEASLDLAQAQLALVKADPRPEDVAVIEAQLGAAEAAIARATAQRDQLTDGASDAQIAAAQAERALAQAQRTEAYNLHEQTMECFTFKLPGGDKQTICPALGAPEEKARFALEAAEAALAATETKLAATEHRAQTRLRAAQSGIAAAAAQRDAFQAQLTRAQAGSTPEQIASAEAQATQSRAALAAAEAALEKTELRAPFDGTVIDISVEVGDTAAPGEIVVVLATLDHLRVRTTELTELDVARVETGQVAIVTLEALPGLELKGHVDRVGEQSVEYRGDVTYPVYVALEDEVSRLRWGMTARVEIRLR